MPWPMARPSSTYLFKDPKGGEFDKLSYAEAFRPWGWTIASGVLTMQVDAIFMEAAMTSGAIALGVTLLLLVIGVLISRSISKPIAGLNANMVALAHNDFDIELKGQDRKDEIGDMARAVEVFRENGLKVSQMTEAEAARIIADQAARQQMMTELQGAFGAGGGRRHCRRFQQAGGYRIPRCRTQRAGRQRQQSGGDGRSRHRRSRPGADGAGRYRPDQAHGGRL